jgi:hypothetical protein
MRNRRLYRRVGLEAEFDIDGTPVQLVDLSMGGFSATAAPRLQSNAILPVRLCVSVDGVDISAQMHARIVYTKELRVGGNFLEPTTSQVAFLRYVVTWRGQAVGSAGVTQMLDAITGWADRDQPKQREREMPPPPPPEPASLLSRWIERFRGRGRD